MHLCRGGGRCLAVFLAVVLALACSGGLAPAPSGHAALLASLENPVPPSASYPGQVVLVSVAGLTPDLYLRTPTPMPILADLARAGVAAEFVVSVVPAAIYPVHTSLVTGRSPNDHGVPADRMLGDRGVRRARYWHASYVRGATLWQSAIDARIGVAALDWPATLGAVIPLLLPDVLPTRRGQRWIDLLAGTATPWLLELARSDPEKLAAGGRPGAPRDALLVDQATGHGQLGGMGDFRRVNARRQPRADDQRHEQKGNQSFERFGLRDRDHMFFTPQ